MQQGKNEPLQPVCLHLEAAVQVCLQKKEMSQCETGLVSKNLIHKLKHAYNMFHKPYDFQTRDGEVIILP